MASTKVHGITIELDADTSGVSKAFSEINKQVNSTAKELKTVEKMLQLDPSNTVLLEQKQKLLADSIKGTTDKLELLKKAQDQADNSDDIDKESKAYRELQRDIESTKSKLNNLNDEAKEIPDSFDEASSSALNFSDILSADVLSNVITSGLSALASAVKAVGDAFVDVISSGVEYNATMETYTTAFTAMLGSAEEAEKTLASIRESASTSPFDVASLVQANQALLTTGESGEKAQKIINALGDAVAYTGGGNDELTRMASNLQQIKNVGKATSADIKQFGMAGIDIYGILSDSMGYSTEQIKEMDISYEDLTKALEKAASEGGKYYGAMERSADTYSGQLGKLETKWQEMTGTISQPVNSFLTDELFPELSAMIDELQPVLQSMVDSVVTFLKDHKEELVQMVEDVFEWLTDEDTKSFFSTLFTFIDDKLPKLVKDMNVLKLDLSDISGFCSVILDVIIAVSDMIDKWLTLDFDALFFNNDAWNKFLQLGGGSISSGGFNGMNSGGFAGSGFNTNVTINVANNGSSITRQQVLSWADVITERVNENLGGMI